MPGRVRSSGKASSIRSAGAAAVRGGWWIIDQPELHLGEDIVVPDVAGWRRETMPEYPDARRIAQPRETGSARSCRTHTAAGPEREADAIPEKMPAVSGSSTPMHGCWRPSNCTRDIGCCWLLSSTTRRSCVPPSTPMPSRSMPSGPRWSQARERQLTACDAIGRPCASTSCKTRICSEHEEAAGQPGICTDDRRLTATPFVPGVSEEPFGRRDEHGMHRKACFSEWIAGWRVGIFGLN